jgi:hypothetical protein
MFDHGNRTFVATVIFVDIVGYSKHTVSIQMQLRMRFNEIVHGVLGDIALNERILLDTGDGAALCFLGDPEDGLLVANLLRDALLQGKDEPPLQLRLGINLGGVKLIKDINGQPSIIGDAINSAQRIMSFAEPNQILVSRSFCEMISNLNPSHERLFQYMGVRKDKHVREHEIYVIEGAYPGSHGRPGQGDMNAMEGGGETLEAGKFEPAFLSNLEACSIKYIGPIGRVMVNKVRRYSQNPVHFCHSLAGYIPEEIQRTDFLQEALSYCGISHTLTNPRAENGESD